MSDDPSCAKCGHPRSNHPYRHPFVGPSRDQTIKEQRYRIEELEAKLAKAAEALVQLVVEYDEVDLAYDEPTSMTSAVNVARLITAELKGETDAPE